MRQRIAAITGVSGFIGRHIAQQLLAQGWRVRGLSQMKDLHIPGVEIVHGDILSSSALKELLSGANSLFHCVAELKKKERMLDVNVHGTAAVVEAVSASDVEYFCHMSSVSVYGVNHRHMIDDMDDCNPATFYAKTKWEAEQLVSAVSNKRVCIIRPANVVDSRHPGIINLAADRSFKNKIKTFFSGNEYSHVIHAYDVAAAALFFQDKPLKDVERFSVSYDDDVRNTVGQVCAMYRSCLEGREVVPGNACPLVLSYLIRLLSKGSSSLHGNVRYSSQRLFQYGFKYPLGLEKCIEDIYMGDSEKNGEPG